MRLLERGTLYVAKFNSDGSGEWLPLVQGQHGLDATTGFPSQAEVAIYARAAADVVGATKMDRPEWIAFHPTTKEVYCTLTSNTTRGTDKGPAVDAANPRANNVYGHIIRFTDPLPHVVDGRRLQLKRDGGLAHHRGVDGLHAWRIMGRRESNRGCHGPMALR